MALSGETLHNILSGCLKNDEQQKEALYKGFYGYVKSVVIRYVKDYQVVEELVNDSFVKIFGNIATFKSLEQPEDISAPFRSWISKITSRTSIDYLRKKKIDFSKDEITDYDTGIASYQPANQEVKDILSLLNGLPQTQKVIFNLYEIEGFTHQEIGQILGISENVSRSYLSRAKSKLKTLYFQNF